MLVGLDVLGADPDKKKGKGKMPLDAAALEALRAKVRAGAQSVLSSAGKTSKAASKAPRKGPFSSHQADTLAKAAGHHASLAKHLLAVASMNFPPRLDRKAPGAPHPDFDLRAPGAPAPQPRSDRMAPGAPAPQPRSDRRAPGAPAPQPRSDRRAPGAPASQPRSDRRAPGAPAPQPRSDRRAPGVGQPSQLVIGDAVADAQTRLDKAKDDYDAADADLKSAKDDAAKAWRHAMDADKAAAANSDAAQWWWVHELTDLQRDAYIAMYGVDVQAGPDRNWFNLFSWAGAQTGDSEGGPIRSGRRIGIDGMQRAYHEDWLAHGGQPASDSLDAAANKAWDDANAALRLSDVREPAGSPLDQAARTEHDAWYALQAAQALVDGQDGDGKPPPDDKTPDDKTPDDKTPDDKTPDDKTPDGFGPFDGAGPRGGDDQQSWSDQQDPFSDLSEPYAPYGWGSDPLADAPSDQLSPRGVDAYDRQQAPGGDLPQYASDSFDVDQVAPAPGVAPDDAWDDDLFAEASDVDVDELDPQVVNDGDWYGAGDVVVGNLADYSWGEKQVIEMVQYHSALGRPQEFEAAVEAVYAAYEKARTSFATLAAFVRDKQMKQVGADATDLMQREAAWANARGSQIPAPSGTDLMQREAAWANTRGSQIPAPSGLDSAAYKLRQDEGGSLLDRLSPPAWAWWLAGAAVVGGAGWLAWPHVARLVAKRRGAAA